MQVLIVGDSHTGALERGRALLEQQDALPRGVTFRIVPLGTGARMDRPFWQDRGDHAVVVDKHYRQRLARIPPDDPRPDAIGLSMPLWPGRVMRSLLTEGTLPYGIAAQGRVISRALLRRIVEADMVHTMGLARFLQGQGLPVFVVEPPGVFRDYRFAAPGLGPVVALQTAVHAIQRAEVAAAGLPVVAVPADAFDGDGVMRESHRHEDPTDLSHANAAFGAMMLLAALPILHEIAAPGRHAAAGLRGAHAKSL